VSQDKGKRAAAWVARYLRTGGWYPQAEEQAGGRAGVDILKTEPVAFEIKTGTVWREAWLKQAAGYQGEIKVLVYLAPGIGEGNVANAQFIVPMHVGMQLLRKAGYTT
jgi:hypothetical protein